MSIMIIQQKQHSNDDRDHRFANSHEMELLPQF